MNGYLGCIHSLENTHKSIPHGSVNKMTSALYFFKILLKDSTGVVMYQ
jgi:hypothetical protein